MRRHIGDFESDIDFEGGNVCKTFIKVAFFGRDGVDVNDANPRGGTDPRRRTMTIEQPRGRRPAMTIEQPLLDFIAWEGGQYDGFGGLSGAGWCWPLHLPLKASPGQLSPPFPSPRASFRPRDQDVCVR